MEEEYKQNVELPALISDKETDLYRKTMDAIDGKTLGLEGGVAIKLAAWNSLMAALKEFNDAVIVLRNRTPVNHASNECQFIGCQSAVLYQKKKKYNDQSLAFTNVCNIVDETLAMVDQLAEKKLLVVEDWWKMQAAELRRRLEDIKRVL